MRCRWTETLLGGRVDGGETSNWYRIVSFRLVESFVKVGGLGREIVIP